MKGAFYPKKSHRVARASILLLIVALIAGAAGCSSNPSQNLEIRTWYDLDAVRDNLAGSYILMNDLDSTTAGYTALAGPTANEGKGWQPIGTVDERFAGVFDGQEHEIRDLFINRPEEGEIGLFGHIGGEGTLIKNVGVVDADVTGWETSGSLVGYNELGTIDNCYATGSVAGDVEATGMGGLVGMNERGTVVNCYATSSVAGGWQYGVHIGGLLGLNEDGVLADCHATGSVTGDSSVGGLVGHNQPDGALSNCYATGSVIGDGEASGIGGLAGSNFGTVSNCYATGSVTGGWVSGDAIGGLVGDNGRQGTISNSYYNYDTALINGEKIITIGALFDEDFDEWQANGKFLDINGRLSEEDGYYVVNDVTDFKQLLAFGQDDALKFSLASDLDLTAEPNLYIPYLAGDFDGGNHTVFNLNVSFDFLSHVGLFGYLADGASTTSLGVEGASIDGADYVGGVIGFSKGTVSNCYASGSVTGKLYVGGLAGDNYHGTVSNSSSTANVISSGPYGDGSCAGSLLGGNDEGAVSDCYSTGSVTGEDNVGGLVGWNIAGTVSNSHSTGSMTGDYHVGGLIGTNGYSGTVSNSYSTGSVYGSMYSVGGLIGDNGGAVSNSYSTGSVTGEHEVGGLTGYNNGIVSNSYSAGSVTGEWDVGGLVGSNLDTVSNSYSTGSVTGDYDLGGLIGYNNGIVSNSYSAGSVTGESGPGGLVGLNPGTVSNSFWDTETSGQATSAGGTGKTTAEMQNITTFSAATWDIVGVANPDVRNPAYIWNIVDGVTYPFLSWQSI